MLTRIREDLWETQGDKPFPGVTTHAYLWTGGPAGNVLFYSTGSERDFDEIERLGGIAHHYLSHRDEAGPMVASIAARFGARLHAGRADAPSIRVADREVDWIDERTLEPTGVEVIPSPGHTPGSVCFVVQGASGQRFLFTGDTLYVDDGGAWKAGDLSFSDPVTLAQSLDVLAALQPDVAISSAAPTGVGVHDIDGEWARIVRDAKARIRAR